MKKIAFALILSFAASTAIADAPTEPEIEVVEIIEEEVIIEEKPFLNEGILVPLLALIAIGAAVVAAR